MSLFLNNSKIENIYCNNKSLDSIWMAYKQIWPYSDSGGEEETPARPIILNSFYLGKYIKELKVVNYDPS